MYTTEMMEKILTSESGQRMIQRVTHKYGESYVGLWLFQVMGLSNDEIKALVDDFKLQVVPQTATWSLPWWENSKGLPIDTSLSIEERRMRIIEKQRRRSPMNPTRFEQIISDMVGADVWLDEYAGKNRFELYIYELPSLKMITQIRKCVKQIKQSHRVVGIHYEKSSVSECNICEGGIAIRNYGNSTVSADTTLIDALPIYSATYIGTATIDKQYNAVASQQYNDFDEIKNMTYQDMANKRYIDVLYKEK